NNGKDPEETNPRYRIRGNGIRTFKPTLTEGSMLKSIHSISNCKVIKPSGIVPARTDEIGEVVFKIEGANVITRLLIKAVLLRKTNDDINHLSISTTNGLTWKQVWNNNRTGLTPISLNLVNEVNGSYEVLVKFVLKGNAAPSDACLNSIEFETITMLNSKTQPKLLLGKNTVYVGVGDQADSIVVWPDLQGKKYLPYIVEKENIISEEKHVGYQGVMHAVEAKKQAHVVFRIDTPEDITRINYGGRFYNRAPQSRIELLHSFDAGKTWNKTYSLTRIKPPWDVIHYETIDKVPAATRSVLFKYLLNSSQAGTSACSIYSVRMEVNHRPKDASFKPLEVTFDWSELQQDYSLLERSHTELIQIVPYRYTINVGGVDHPVVNSLRINLKGALPNLNYGYSDGKDVGGEKYVPRWVTYGKNLAEGNTYTVSVPSNKKWDAGDPEGKKLTDGIVGPPYAGGIGPRYALCWDKGTNPQITVDLGSPQSCGAFRIHLSAGWPWWDALKGQVKDKVELLTSTDDKNYTNQGFFPMNLRWKDIPVNHMMPDDETATGFTYDLVPTGSVQARYVRFKITPERTLTVSEVQVLNYIETSPFDLRITLPDAKRPGTVAGEKPAPNL
ncbi:MAG: hypothetical protein ACYSUY_08950, partial [Planctomycetota bacterium]